MLISSRKLNLIRRGLGSLGSLIKLDSLGLRPFFALDNMGRLKENGTSGLINNSTSAKHVFDHNNNIQDCQPGEIRIHGARRVNHADGIDYGYGVLGVKYYDTDETGIKINPIPALEHLSAINNIAYPSATSDISDYESYGNFQNGTSNPSNILNKFNHSVSVVNLTGSETTLYHHPTFTVGDIYTVAVIVKMNDLSVPKVIKTSGGPGDFTFVIGGTTTFQAAAGNDVIVQHLNNNIYYVANTFASGSTQINFGIYKPSATTTVGYEIYSCQVFEGKHLYPVYVETTTASSALDSDKYIVDSTDNFYQDSGILVTKAVYKDPTVQGNEGIVGLPATLTLLYRYNNSLRIFDYINSIISIYKYVENIDLVSGSYWQANDGKMGVFGSQNGAVPTIEDLNYDGSFDDLGTIRLFTSNKQQVLLKDLKMYRPVGLTEQKIQDWITQNAIKVTNNTAPITPYISINRKNEQVGMKLENLSTSAKTFLNSDGEYEDTLPGEIVLERAQRINHNDGIDYGFGVNGIEYIDVNNNANLRYQPAVINYSYPSETSDVTDYPTRGNIKNVSVNNVLGHFNHAVAVNSIGTTTYAYRRFDLAANKTYTLQIFVKMDDLSEPVVSGQSADMDFKLISQYVVVSNFLVTHIANNVYCVSAIFTTTTAASQKYAGLVKYGYNSSKNFEMYCLQFFDGAHDLPLYVPTTTTSTALDADVIVSSTANNEIIQDKGIFLFRYKMQYGPGKISSLLNTGLVSTNDNLGSGNILTTREDGLGSDIVFYITKTLTSSWTYLSPTPNIGDDIVAACIFDIATTTLKVMVSVNNAAFTTTTKTNYASDFIDIVNEELYIFANAFHTNELTNLKIYHNGFENMSISEMQTWVEDNAHKLTDT